MKAERAAHVDSGGVTASQNARQPSCRGLVGAGGVSDLFAACFGDALIGGRAARSRGADLVAEVEIDLADAAKGVSRGVPFEVAVACSHCEGSGAEPGSAITTCPTCGGLGRL